METSFKIIAVFTFLAILQINAQNVPGKYAPVKTIRWYQCLSQDESWYSGKEALRIADNVLEYQKSSGGWEKNIDMAEPLDTAAVKKLRTEKDKIGSTIDNGATYTQLRFLAKVYDATHVEKYKSAFLKGYDYLLEAQYENGGWPQFYPLRKGYYTHITFNDNAMINVMRLLRDSQTDPVFDFVDTTRKAKAKTAVEKGIDCILKCQIVVDGKLTAWCAQHDEYTFKPAKARAYELPTLSGFESAEIVDFLMKIKNPSQQIIDAVQSAVAWFDEAKLTGIRQILVDDASAPEGKDKRVIEDPSAPPIWARFYEIGTNKPVFCSRDGIIHHNLSEITSERRNEYNWLGDWPEDLLNKKYPKWIKQHSLKNVLNNN